MVNDEWLMVNDEYKKAASDMMQLFFAFDFDYNSEWDSITNKKYLLDSLNYS